LITHGDLSSLEDLGVNPALSRVRLLADPADVIIEERVADCPAGSRKASHEESQIPYGEERAGLNRRPR
jgi:hypothetical protein